MDLDDPRSILFNLVLNLLEDVDLGDFNLKLFSKEKSIEILKKLEGSDKLEEDLFDIIVKLSCESFEVDSEAWKNKTTFVDMTKTSYGLYDLPTHAPNIVKSIGYLQDLISKFKNGEIETMTAIALLKDGRASVWMPAGLEKSKADSIYDPIIEALKDSDSTQTLN